MAGTGPGPELAPDLSSWTQPAARALLAAVPRRPGIDMVFSITGRTLVSGFSRAKLRLDAAIVAERAERALRAGGKPAPLVAWRLHDLRRTGVTVMAGLGVRWEVADRVLNHVAGAISGVAAVYQRHEFLREREEALRIWAEHVTALAGEQPSLLPPAAPSKPPRRPAGTG